MGGLQRLTLGAGGAVRAFGAGQSGKWIGANGIFGTVAPTVNKPYISIVSANLPATYDTIGVYVSTAGDANSLARLGIYNVDVFGNIGEKILDAGTVSTASTGNKTIAISQVLPALFALVLVIQPTGVATPTTYAIGGEVPTIPQTALADVAHAGLTADDVTGALPTTLTNVVHSTSWMARTQS